MLVIGVQADVRVDASADGLIKVLTSVVVGISIDLLVGVEIIVLVASAVISSEFAMSVPYAVDVLFDVRLDALYAGVNIIIVSGISVDMLIDVDVNLLRAVMIALKLIAPASLVPFC